MPILHFAQGDQSRRISEDYGVFAKIRGRFYLTGWPIVALALLSFAVGSAISAWFSQPTNVRADSTRSFQLMIYHAKPGKAVELESVFREVSKLQAQHNLNVLGYWVPSDESAWKDTFVYLVSHKDEQEAKKNWDELHSDPAFPPYRRAAAPLIEQVNGAYRVEEIFMRPSDYSAMK